MNKTNLPTALLLAALATFPLAARSVETNETQKPSAAANPLAMFSNEVVAQGKGVKITRAMLDETLVGLRGNAAARGQTIPEQQMKQLEAQILSRMIGIQLVRVKATEEDKKSGTEAAQKQLAQLKQNSGSEENFNLQVKTAGMTPDSLIQKMTEEAIADAVIQRELGGEVSDAEAKKFYDENPDKFERPEQVRAAHILIGTQDKDGAAMSEAKKKEQLKKAEDVLKRVKAGEDFAKLAKEFSEDPGSKDKGGEYTFPRGQMVPEFETMAFNLKTNQVGEIVTTQFGYHIIKTLEKIPAKKDAFDEVSPRIKQFLKANVIQQKIAGYLAAMYKEANIEILDPGLKKITAEMEEAAKQAQEKKAEPEKAPEKK